jgi:hypothetical protein
MESKKFGENNGEKINLCKTGGIISVCAGCESPKNQKNCEFYGTTKTKTGGECEHLTFGEYCYSRNAQDKANNKIKETESEVEEEMRENPREM